MTTDTDLGALIARVEASTVPDCEIDAAIFYDVLGFCRHDHVKRSGAQSDTGFDCFDCGADSWGNLGSKGQRLHDSPPAYTASLDAAMSLVPKGRPFDLGCEDDGQSDWVADLTCFAPKGSDDHSLYVRAATPALALVAAALRARVAVGETGGAA